MSVNSKVSEDLINAYSKAIYKISFANTKCEFKVGQVSLCMADILIRNQATSATLLTAFNPLSVVHSMRQNLKRHKELLNLLVNLDVRFVDATGEDPAGIWSPELGFLIFNLGRDKSDSLALQFEQNAYVLIDESGMAELRLVL
ncbi:DUF3293 domain-containing protein [Limnobacter sp. UBA3528]|uniref:DUF3293 domain-containing protein n=1 Tax=Limnobacter sp. UBA3528 TaxID=1946760 RepID=UPI0025BBA378|nr:DUF3293 domain-containing protein [Limnobacter sp. UBA3528]